MVVCVWHLKNLFSVKTYIASVLLEKQTIAAVLCMSFHITHASEYHRGITSCKHTVYRSASDCWHCLPKWLLLTRNVLLAVFYLRHHVHKL